MALFGPMVKGTSNFGAFLDGRIPFFFAGNVSSIRQYAFDNCSNLKKVYLGQISSMGTNAFYNCLNLQEVDISGATSYFALPSSNSIPNNENLTIYTSSKLYSAFYGNENWALYGSKVVNKNEHDTSMDNFLYKASTDDNIIKVVKGEAVSASTSVAQNIRSNLFRDYANDITLTLSGITEVKDYAFYNATNVTLTAHQLVSLGLQVFYNASNVTLSASNLTTIQANTFRNAGFVNLSGPNVSYVYSNAFNNVGTALLNLCNLQSISTNACRNVGLISPASNFNSLRSVSGCAFVDSGIFYVNSSVGLNTIGYCSFTNCRNLVSVNIENNASLDYFAFSNCINLTSISATIINRPTFAAGIFSNCQNLSLNLLSNVINVGDSAFHNTGRYRGNFGTINLPCATNFGDYCFANTTGTLIISQDPTNIGNYAFMNTKYRSWHIDSNNVYIGNGAFLNSNIEGFGSSSNYLDVRKLGPNAFNGTKVSTYHIFLNYNNGWLSSYNNIPEGAFCNMYAAAGIRYIKTKYDILYIHANALRGFTGTLEEGSSGSVDNPITAFDNGITNSDFYYVLASGRNTYFEQCAANGTIYSVLSNIGANSTNYNVKFINYGGGSVWFRYQNGEIKT